MGLDRSKFRPSTRVRVRNYEIDWQGLVHNANFPLYFEVGRLTYLGQIGITVDIDVVRGDSRVLLREMRSITALPLGEARIWMY